MSIVWEGANQPVTLQMLKDMEVKLGIRFPKDFVECVIQNHGGHPFPDVFDFGNHKGAVFGRLLSLDTNEFESVQRIYEASSDELPDGVVPFALDPAGNLICFDYVHGKQSDPVVVFLYHEFALTRDDFEDLTETDRGGLTYDEFLREEAIRPICGSFSELLSMLHEGDGEE
ncbi:SMI1/KNR4 family protein [Tumebacillus flagellatus]|uniref:Knr4/Smi1-like domain-containing protein n=1 Tax=Tumebacillus flagellatus TaxID=1157490 RepID=A0A074LTP1_9BACL|nr:SMI1/KNR4 family protein [Tumebacillus flagellatus]KEO84484.1 hypothetical protein EL26_05130 [Tumebacillus flagellatus]